MMGPNKTLKRLYLVLKPSAICLILYIGICVILFNEDLRKMFIVRLCTYCEAFHIQKIKMCTSDVEQKKKQEFRNVTLTQDAKTLFESIS